MTLQIHIVSLNLKRFLCEFIVNKNRFYSFIVVR